MKSPDNQNLLKEIENRLQRIANVLLLNASFIDNPGLLNGKMGIAIFFYHYSRYSKNKTYEDYAGELVDEIYEEINTSTAVNFENGLTGIGWGIEYLVKNGFVQADTDDALEEVDNIVYRNSLYRPFLLESGKDLFGYGLYFLARLRGKGYDDNNIKTLFKKQHLIYLTDDCERILINKRFLDFKIECPGIDTINSIAWFLLEMHRWGIFPFKIEKLLNALPEYLEFHSEGLNDPSATVQMKKLVEYIIPCIRDALVKDRYNTILNGNASCTGDLKNADSESIRNFTKTTWQNLIYEPYIPGFDSNTSDPIKVFQIIDNEDNWNKLLEGLTKDNLGLKGLAGIGIGLLQTRGTELRAQCTEQEEKCTELRAQSTEQEPPGSEPCALRPEQASGTPAPCSLPPASSPAPCSLRPEPNDLQDFKTDLSDVTFVVPLRIDSPERKANIDTLVKYTFRNFSTKFIILEADSERRYFPETDQEGFRYEFIEDKDEVFHRTLWINRLLNLSDTPVVGIWDADAIAPPEQIVEAVIGVRTNAAVLCLPYDGRFYACDRISCDLFKKLLNIEILSRRQSVMNIMDCYYSVGGVFIANKNTYLTIIGENENFFGREVKDPKRVKQTDLVSLPKYYSYGPLFQLSHPISRNSWFLKGDIERSYMYLFQILCKSDKLKRLG
jgi:hypothetical protein